MREEKRAFVIALSKTWRLRSLSVIPSQNKLNLRGGLFPNLMNRGDGDVLFRGGELIVKRWKPYTVTKQPEKWTEEEHNKFLKALKLYGRAWQRIQEHIGTKTAVQIRNHAQKIFSKLEKEAQTKGTPVRQSHDIEIPPPRPKRKSTCPYPRNTAAGSPSPLERRK